MVGMELQSPTGRAAHGQRGSWPMLSILLGGRLAFSSHPGGWLGCSVEPWRGREELQAQTWLYPNACHAAPLLASVSLPPLSLVQHLQ